MFDSIAERYDLTNAVLSAGVHHIWRGALFREIDRVFEIHSGETSRPQVALDLCSGTGDLLQGLMRRFSGVLGIDFCYPMVRVGKRRLGSWSPFVVGDAHYIPLPDMSVDLVSIAYGVRNFERLDHGLKEVMRVLKPDGLLVILDFGTPTIPIVKALFTAYSRFVIPILGGLLTGNRAAYEYLPESSQKFMCGPELCERLSSHGYGKVSYRPLSGGIAYLYTAHARYA